jgi:signal transduction histidine kinase
MILRRPHSIQARYTTTATALLLLVLLAVSATSTVAIRFAIQDGIFDDAERVASQWSAAERNGEMPITVPTTGRVGLVQLVDVNGNVLKSSKEASGPGPLSMVRPPADDRFQRVTSGCLMLMAIRISPAVDSPVLFAGLQAPAILCNHHLEYILGAGALTLLGIAAWMIWMLVGRTLRPVAAIRSRMSEITVSNLSLRVPVPPGEDEIALLARTANQTLTRLEEAVEQQRRFASTTSHELKTPIAGLRAQFEVALRYPEDVDPRSTIRKALSATDRLEAIVNDLLLLARLRAADPAPPEVIDLGELVAQEATGSETVPVYVHAAADVLVCGSRIQLVRVVGNLLSNARRHADTSVKVFVESVDGQAVMAVTDDGAGVAPADRERVFERFIRLDDGRRRDPGGSGLGLAISRDITRAHRGSLRIEDSLRGARFVLRLPILSKGDKKACQEGAEAREAGEPAVTSSLETAALIKSSHRRDSGE